jgi:hypothetical protein
MLTTALDGGEALGSRWFVMGPDRARPTTAARRRLPALALLSVIIVCAAVAIAASDADTPRSGVTETLRIAVGSRTISRPVPAGFVGLSLEYPAPLAYLGGNPRTINPAFLRLVRGLAPGQSPVIRIGGQTTESTWWPIAGVAPSRGLRYALTPRWLAVVHALGARLGARFILGVNLEADNERIAGAEARALERGIGRRYIAGFELGNEPEVYSTLGWYKDSAGVAIQGRRRSYNFRAYVRDYARVSRALPANVPLVGPASGGPRWVRGLSRFLARSPRVGTVTYHRYPLHRCLVGKGSPNTPTIGHLLSTHASSWPATTLERAAAVAHRHGLPFRSDELNSVSCGGARGVSDVFASALWAIDTLFQMARAGVDGVNVHTFPSAVYAPFAFTRAGGRWRAEVRPLYAGLALFARVAPPGSRLLATSGATPSTLRTWATRGRDGTIRVVLVNDSRRSAAVARVALPSGARRVAEVSHLIAPGAAARTGVRLTAPVRERAGAGGYVMRLGPASAEVLTVRAR